MLEDLKGKTALVTGSGKKSGIGFAIVRRLASCGTDVIISDLGTDTSRPGEVKTGTTEEMEALAAEVEREFSVRTMAVPMDVTSVESIDQAAQIVKERFPRLDILCNNAGASFGVPSAIHTYEDSEWLKTVDVNLHSVFRVSKAFLPLMTGHGGSIVNTASRAGKVPALFNGAYSVAKAGVIMLTKVMAREVAGLGIRVNAVCPGQIMTELERWRFELEAKFTNSTFEERVREMCKSIPMNRIGEPAEVANLVAFLASDASSFVTGQAYNVTGGQLMEL